MFLDFNPHLFGKNIDYAAPGLQDTSRLNNVNPGRAKLAHLIHLKFQQIRLNECQHFHETMLFDTLYLENKL